MGWFSKNKKFLRNEVKDFNWLELTEINQLDSILSENNSTILIFKHSTRCSISKMVLNRFQSEWKNVDEDIIPLYLDLLAHRNISDSIAAEFEIRHESPQILLIKNGKCIYSASHTSISVKNLIQFLQSDEFRF